MSHEIEAKIKVDALEAVAETLKSCGGVLLYDSRQVDVYFSDADGWLKKNDCGLRIRRQWIGDEYVALVTFKGAKLDGPYKSRPEYETGVDDVEMTVKIFESLGYHQRITVEKKRTVWELDACDVCLDEVARLGCFVEVEGADEDVIAGVLEKLGLQNAPVLKRGYASMTAKLLKQEKS